MGPTLTGYLVLVARVYRMYDCQLYVNFGLQGCRGPNLFAPIHIMHTVWLGAKMATACEGFEFSLRIASNDHYIERNDSSTPILPTINDI